MAPSTSSRPSQLYGSATSVDSPVVLQKRDLQDGMKLDAIGGHTRLAVQKVKEHNARHLDRDIDRW